MSPVPPTCSSGLLLGTLLLVPTCRHDSRRVPNATAVRRYGTNNRKPTRQIGSITASLVEFALTERAE